MGEPLTEGFTWQPWNRFNRLPVPNSITSHFPFFRLKKIHYHETSKRDYLMLNLMGEIALYHIDMSWGYRNHFYIF